MHDLHPLSNLPLQNLIAATCPLFHTNIFAVTDWRNSPDDYYGPYFAVCQSSGYGKSRLITEVFPICYLGA